MSRPPHTWDASLAPQWGATMMSSAPAARSSEMACWSTRAESASAGSSTAMPPMWWLRAAHSPPREAPRSANARSDTRRSSVSPGTDTSNRAAAAAAAAFLPMPAHAMPDADSAESVASMPSRPRSSAWSFAHAHACKRAAESTAAAATAFGVPAGAMVHSRLHTRTSDARSRGRSVPHASCALRVPESTTSPSSDKVKHLPACAISARCAGEKTQHYSAYEVFITHDAEASLVLSGKVCVNQCTAQHDVCDSRRTHNQANLSAFAASLRRLPRPARWMALPGLTKARQQRCFSTRT